MSTPASADHIYVRPLTTQDVDACEALSKASLQPCDQCPHEKLMAHLRAASAYTLGVCTTVLGPTPHEELLGYTIATKTYYPLDEESLSGHVEAGDTLTMQAFLVHPEQNGKGLGGLLVKAWTDRMRNAKVARRVVVLVAEDDDEAIRWWNGFGFVDWGHKVLRRKQLVLDI